MLDTFQLESVGTTIRLEQSMTDRRRSEFSPIEYVTISKGFVFHFLVCVCALFRVEVPANAEEPAKHTACRLHFGYVPYC